MGKQGIDMAYLKNKKVYNIPVFFILIIDYIDNLEIPQVFDPC